MVGRKTDGEKSPFLSPQMPLNDDLNFKGVTMESIKPPKDKFKIVFLIFVLHGLGTLMPWNMFITAKSYFVDFKLSTGDGNSTSVYATNFMQYIGFASQIPNFIFNWLNVFVNLGGDLTKRIVFSIVLEIIIFIITVILAMLDSSDWPGSFFFITMISVVLLNMANGIYQNTIYGMAATLPVKYTGAVVLGSNISGLFASVISICSSSLFSSKRTSAIYYFITAMFILLTCFDTYFALPLNKYFCYYQNKEQSNSSGDTKKVTVKESVPYWKIFKQAFPQLFNVFFIFFVTLSVFPAVYSDIKPMNENFVISSDMFTSITCFLTFNLFAMLGSLTTSWLQWPKPQFLVIPVVLRAVFLPLFLFCNYLPKDIERTLPILISNDWAYWFMAMVMSFSSGYLSSLAMMYAPQTVESKYQLKTGMFAAAMLMSGIFFGVLFSFVFPLLVQL